MKCLVTGSTGFVGTFLSLELARQGQEVHALVRRNPEHPALQHPNIRFFKGDLMNLDSLEKAMEGCAYVYHVAAFTGIWTPDPKTYYNVNVRGTENVLSTALKMGVKKVVLTSTAGVMGPSPEKGVLVDESANGQLVLASEYERTKYQSEQVAWGFCEQGLDVVAVNPTRVYGPGILNETNALAKIILLWQKNKWRFVPGNGDSVGNYVLIDDVVQGHLLAMEKGQTGQRYILGGVNLSYNELFDHLRQLTNKDPLLLHLPLSVMAGFASTELWMANTFGKKPFIVPYWVKKLTRDWYVSSAKAQQELGYSITPVEEGLERTVEWVRTQL